MMRHGKGVCLPISFPAPHKTSGGGPEMGEGPCPNYTHLHVSGEAGEVFDQGAHNEEERPCEELP